MLCYRPEGILRVDGTQRPEIGDVFTCKKCWKLLQDKKTALPLIRGHLTMVSRGTLPDEDIERYVNAFMEGISKLKLRN